MTGRESGDPRSIAPTGDAGSGLLSTSIGILVFLCLLLLAVQVLFALYATSTVTAAAWDAARIASGSEATDSVEARSRAEAHVRRVLGKYGDRVRVEWTDDPDDVVLTVSADQPSLIPRPLRRPMGLDRIHRTVRLRQERVR